MGGFRYSAVNNLALKSNPEFCFSLDHSLALFKKNAVYTFIPKNACSTIRYSLAIANGCLGVGEDVNWIHKNNKTFVVDLRDAVVAEYSFVFLRCPFRRLASVFLDKIVNKEGPTAWMFYDLIGREIALDDLTFNDFVHLLLDRGLIRREIHWRPQIDFLLYKEYSDVFAIEEFAKAANVLKEKIGFKIYDARPLTKHGSDQFELIEDGLWHNVPVKEIGALRNIGKLPSTDSMYSKSLYSLVSRGYASDIDLYKRELGFENILKLR